MREGRAQFKVNMSLQEENERLKRRIEELERQNNIFEQSRSPEVVWPLPAVEQLSNAEIKRFGRQLILPDVGITGQKKLRNTSMLVVGAGGLGSPICLYLGGAGVGRIGIVDHDEVDISNLHRQVIHTENGVGVNKAHSAAESIRSINSHCEVIAYDKVLDSSNAMDIIPNYDIVLDATDNVATRYLLNDACVLAGKPLVSGSALRMEGQLTTYNYNGGPCYRCLYPTPPPPETVTNCADGGVLGAIPGVIGCLQALQAIKICIGLADTSFLARDPPTLLIFSGASSTLFRTIKLRKRKEDCAVCGENPSITELIDYVQFCGRGATDKDEPLKVLEEQDRIMVEAYQQCLTDKTPHMLLDVREPVQYEICQLPGSYHIPLKQLKKRIDDVKQELESRNLAGSDVYVICRLGNDSQLAVRILEENGISAKDIVGGLYEWANRVDKEFPMY
ncbi:hypothetical protein INT43_004682 [Umbelopsis isabellina]|uniref:Needs CLA4 to survive protein 3 n=1 Tax=Mortierella isabellina TaxID=91625 RepID=A0A8H7PG91_MORIS|nr:hypothetical protein INT43_004682 [Umbelopsis isabellina]